MAASSFVKVLFICCISIITCFPQAQPRSNEKPRPQPPNKLLELDNLRSKSSVKSEHKEFGKVSLKKTVSRKQREQLSPDNSELNTYENFLKQPNTGLIKLFTDIGCEENENLVSVNDACLGWIPMSGFYSFREKEYTRSFLSDIKLKNDMLIAGGLLTQGVLVALGDVSLENVQPMSDGLGFLNDFKPELQLSDVLKQTNQLIKGIKSGNYLYSNILPVNENTTYALRAIAYRGTYTGYFHGQQFNLLGGDDRVDITLVFRVVKRDEAGNLTLLWKKLSERDAPKIIFPKEVKKNRLI